MQKTKQLHVRLRTFSALASTPAAASTPRAGATTCAENATSRSALRRAREPGSGRAACDSAPEYAARCSSSPRTCGPRSRRVQFSAIFDHADASDHTVQTWHGAAPRLDLQAADLAELLRHMHLSQFTAS